MDFVKKIKDLSMVGKVCAILFIVFILTLAYCLYNRKNLIDIQNSKEESSITESFNSNTEAKMTMYYVDWCPHCVSTKPHFQKLMAHNNENINGKVLKVAMVNCEKNPELAEAAGVEGYPTIQLELNAKRHNYDGERTEAGFMSYIKNMLS